MVNINVFFFTNSFLVTSINGLRFEYKIKLNKTKNSNGQY